MHGWGYQPMMGESDPQRTLFYQLSLEGIVPSEHPLRRIRPLIDDQAIRKSCRELYSDIGRPSIPPEQLFLALIGGYLLGIPSERKLVMELQCNMALRWFAGLNLDQDAWDASTFSQNRRRRFDASGVLEKLFDETVKRAMAEGLVSRHVSADGTLVRANASDKSLVPIEVAMDPDEYKKRLRAQDQDDEDGPQDPGNRAVDFRGEKRSNKTHRSATDTDCRFASKGSTGTGAVPGYTVNALMENRSRILMGDRCRDLPLVGVGDGGMHRATRSSEASASLCARDARSRQGLLQRAVHRGDSRPGHRAAHRRFGQRESTRPCAGSHAGARCRLSALAALPQEDRGVVRRSGGLARHATIPKTGAVTGSRGDTDDRLGTQPQAARLAPATSAGPA